MKTGQCARTIPVGTQDSIHNGIANPIIDGLFIRTADEELVLRADERRQMVARHEVLAKTGREVAGQGGTKLWLHLDPRIIKVRCKLAECLSEI